mgnify:CR=1 FL=1
MFSSLMAGHPKKMIIRLSLVFVLLVSVLMAVVYTLNMNNRAQAQLSQMQERAQIRAQDKAGTFDQWLSEVEASSKALTRSDLLRVFLVEQGQKQSQEDAHIQGAYIQHAMGDLQKRLQSRGVLLLSPQGETLLKSPDSQFLSLPQISAPYLLHATQGQMPIMGQMFRSGGASYLEIFLPVFDLAEEAAQQTVGVLYLQASLDPIVQAFTDPLSPYDETYFVAQNPDARWQSLSASKSQTTGEVNPNNKGLAQKHDGTSVLQGVFMLPDQRHAVVHQTDYAWAMADYTTYAKLYKLMLALIVMVLGVVFTALLWYGISQRDKRRVQHLEQMVEAFMKTLEGRDPYLLGHHERVARLAVKMGNALKLPVQDRATLYYSAKLSGIGRMFIPTKILNKKGKITPKERTVLEEHIQHTLRILDKVDFDLPIKETIEQMHERGDGSGYPNKLTLADIDIKAQILGVCDTYCALIEPRIYREALPHKKALDEIEKNTEQYSPILVKILHEK